MVEPEQNSSVTWVAVSEHGCADSITSVILLEKGVILYAPDSFTPDGNEQNPVFLPIVTSEVDKESIRIRGFQSMRK